MTMRIRQVKPAFFKDARIAELAPSVRLFYIGLWMLADDAGWLAWDVAEVGNELYGYQPRKRRERDAAAYLDALVAAERVVRYDCGHLSIPTMTDHQRLSGMTKQVRTTLKEHETRCVPHTPADARDSPHVPDTERNGIGTGKGIGTERLGTERKARERANEEVTTTREEERVPWNLRAVNS
jgi:hypothetical protein